MDRAAAARRPRPILPLLTVLDDDSVLASGDQSKRQTYDLSFQGRSEGRHRAAAGGFARRSIAAARAGPRLLRRVRLATSFLSEITGDRSRPSR